MSEFTKIFKKVGGFDVLKGYARDHVLFYALTMSAINGLNKKGLEIVRLGVSNKVKRRLKKKYDPFIKQKLQEIRKQNLQHHHPGTIWVCWLQGMDQAPWLVQRCYQSLLEQYPDKEIVVLTRDNFKDYTNFPAHILERFEKGQITPTHFSDLLRIELLADKGGTWIDATVFATPISNQQYMLESDLFFFQILKPGLDGHATAISSWFMNASSNQTIILLVRELLYEYWKNHDHLVDYFLLHHFFQLALEACPEDWAKVVPFSSSTPHILLLRFFEPYDEAVWQGVKDQTCFHKLSYKYNAAQAEIPGTYFQKVLMETEQNGKAD